MTPARGNGRHWGKRWQKNSGGRRGERLRASVPKLSDRVVTPTVHRSICDQRTRKSVPRGNSNGILNSGHLPQKIQVRRASVSKLSLVSRSPTVDRPHRSQSTGVSTPRGNRHEPQSIGEYGDGLIARCV